MTDTDRARAASADRPREPRFQIAGHGLVDWAVPALIFVFCAVAAWLATTFDEAPDIIVGDAMQPRAFPMFLMAVIALLNVVLIGQMLRDGRRARSDMPWQTWVCGALLGVFYVLTVTLDMFIALFVSMFCLCLCFGERRWYVALSVAAITPTLIFFLFDLVLRVRFPRGVLTDLYYG